MRAEDRGFYVKKKVFRRGINKGEVHIIGGATLIYHGAIKKDKLQTILHGEHFLNNSDTQHVIIINYKLSRTEAKGL